MRVVVIDDEKRLVGLVVSYLRESGLDADGYLDGRAGLAAVRAGNVDAVVLDLMLPGLGGLEVCRALRSDGNDVPVLMLTARGAVAERVAGLDAGADDYLVKPFAMEELAARLRVVQRRQAIPVPEDRLVVGDLVLDLAEYRAWKQDTPIELSRRELDVLRVLMDNAGRVVSRSHLLAEVWHGEVDIRSNSVDVHVSRLRARIDKPFGTASITTLRGVGYRLERANS